MRLGSGKGCLRVGRTWGKAGRGNTKDARVKSSPIMRVGVDIRKVRRDVEAFVRAMDGEAYEHGAGLKEEMNSAAIYRRFSHLFSTERVSEVARRRAGATGEEARRLRYLQALVTSEHLGNAVKELSDEHSTWEATKSLEVEGEKVPYRMAPALISNEARRERRQALQEASDEAKKEANPRLVHRIQILHGLARELGFRDYMHLYQDIKGLDLGRLRSITDALLEGTADTYRRGMATNLEPFGLRLEEAEKHDIARIMRAKDFDGGFPADGAVPALKRTLKGLGFDLDGQSNITLDLEVREKKSPRAFCAPLEVPTRVMLVTKPQGGFTDYDSLFHEAGHAEHFANVAKTQKMEYKYLGDNSVTESYAFLLQYLLTDPNWLQQYLRPPQQQALLSFLWLQKVYFLRRYAAKLQYEMELHAQGVEGMDMVYRVLMEKALGFRHPEVHYLHDLDDGLYAAQYLRAWIFEAQLRGVLKEKFGEEWFLHAEAGTFIKGLWAQGQKFAVQELAESLGYPGLDSGPLVEELVRPPMST